MLKKTLWIIAAILVLGALFFAHDREPVPSLEVSAGSMERVKQSIQESENGAENGTKSID